VANESQHAHEQPRSKTGNPTHVLDSPPHRTHFHSVELTPLVIIGALLVGIFSIMQTPREEEPRSSCQC